MSNLTNMTPEEREAAGVLAREKKRRIQGCINKRSVKAALGRLREPSEIPDIRTAVKWKCFDCLGWEPDGCGSLLERVRQCECPDCPLYPWRGGVFDISLEDDEFARAKEADYAFDAAREAKMMGEYND